MRNSNSYSFTKLLVCSFFLSLWGITSDFFSPKVLPLPPPLLTTFPRTFPHMPTYTTYPSVILYLSCSDIYHGVQICLMKVEKKVWPLGHYTTYSVTNILLLLTIFNYSCKGVLRFYWILVNVGFLKA